MVEKIKLAHIAPTVDTPYAIKHSGMNMVLAHIAEKDDEYARLFKESDKLTLLDNGAFELGVPYDVERMIEIGHKVGADILVLPDYPLQPWAKGWLTIEQDTKAYKDAGFKTMFAPQSVTGDSLGFEMSIHNALHHPGIDFVGLSILGCPNAFDCVPEHKVRDIILNKFNSDKNAKKFHILGMLGSVDEIKRLNHYTHLIHSWDTSAAVWYGVNNISVQKRTKKFILPVDFSFDSANCENAQSLYEMTRANIKYMASLL